MNHQKDARVDIQDNNEDTALHYAIGGGDNANIVQLLVDAGQCKYEH